MLSAGVTRATCAYCPFHTGPVMNVITLDPSLLFCQMRSLLPSALKSAAAARCHVVSTPAKMEYCPVYVAPFMNVIARSPLPDCSHIMSGLVSPFMSATIASFHDGPRL